MGNLDTIATAAGAVATILAAVLATKWWQARAENRRIEAEAKKNESESRGVDVNSLRVLQGMGFDYVREWKQDMDDLRAERDAYLEWADQVVEFHLAVKDILAERGVQIPFPPRPKRPPRQRKGE